MLEIVQSIILGIIQGLTEFLPVSSSGHLEIFKYLFGEENTPEQSLMQTVALHFATALSTVFIFRKDIGEILQSLFSKRDSSGRRFVLMIILSMIPAVLVGLVWEDLIESLFQGNLLWIGLALILTGLVLYLSDRKSESEKSFSWISALIVGLAQAVAIIPGISRSGATIGTSILLGIDRSKAARFSFLMVIPLIFGKIAKDLIDGSMTSNQISILPLALGFIAAFITGAIACTWMIKWVKKSKLKYFAYYCFIVGLILVIYWNI